MREFYGLHPESRVSLDAWYDFGSKGRVSEVVNGKREISKEQARKLADFFHVSADLFI